MPPNVNKYLVVIAGPTAVGKTVLSADLAGRYETVVVSADSRQIFREMDIGTAKPTPAEMRGVPHHFIDRLSLDTPYSAGRYARDCHALLDELFQEHRLVFLTGGSGLYIRAVIEGFDKMPEVSLEVRRKWERVQAEEGIEALQDAMSRQDPEFASQVDMQNPRRLVRALALMETSGKPVSELRKAAKQALPFEVIRVFCNLPRKELYERVHARVDAMMKAGLVEEVRSLMPYRDAQAMQTVGYKELVAHFDGKYTMDEAIAKIRQHSCNYAKRQITWFRNQGDWTEINPPDPEVIHQLIRETIST